MIKLPTFSKTRHSSSGGQIHASRDWFALVIVAIVLITASTAYNLWLITRVTSGQGFGTLKKQAPIPDVSVANVDAAFAARAANQEIYLHSYHAVDPSTVSR